jgi:hypothetical protein
MVRPREGGIIRGKATPASKVVFNDRNNKRIGTAWADSEGRFELKQTKVRSLEELVPQSIIDKDSLTWEDYRTKGRERRWLWSRVKTVDVVVVDEVHSAKNRNSKMYDALKKSCS